MIPIPDDVSRALAFVCARARKYPQFALSVSHPEIETWGPRSAIATGREVHLRLEGPEDSTIRLGLLWGLCIPYGLTPWLRYPEPGPGDEVFHAWGPWRILEDHLLAAGRGEWVWPSLCAAGQCEVGTWQGSDRPTRLLQAHLHQKGYPCGPVDGIVGPQTSKALAAAGLGSTPLGEALVRLQERKPPPVQAHAPKRGRIDVDAPAVIHTTGALRATRTPKGFTLAIQGEGRVILDIGV